MGAFQKGGTGGYEPPRIPSKDWRSPDESSICSPPACAEREGAMGSLRSGPQRAAGARALHPLPVAGCEVTWVTWRLEQSGAGDITYPPFRIRFPDT